MPCHCIQVKCTGKIGRFSEPKDSSMIFFNSCDGYFFEIKITKIGKRRALPRTNFKNSNRVRLYLPKIAKEKQGMVIKSHFKISFTTSRGYYFDKGLNNKTKEVICFLFQERLDLKKVGKQSKKDLQVNNEFIVWWESHESSPTRNTYFLF